ncbi:MAG: hypothetical protein ACREQV_27000 [Candidatus Binatia bacterium]
MNDFFEGQDREINVTEDEGWDHSLDHYHIDDDDQVQNEVIDWIETHMSR